jgi:hypothetical protein
MVNMCQKIGAFLPDKVSFNRGILQPGIVGGATIMENLPARTAAIRMAIVLVSVCALDIAAVFLIPHPRIVCVIIPTLVPLLTPVILMPLRAKASK